MPHPRPNISGPACLATIIPDQPHMLSPPDAIQLPDTHRREPIPRAANQPPARAGTPPGLRALSTTTRQELLISLILPRTITLTTQDAPVLRGTQQLRRDREGQAVIDLTT